MKLKRFNSNIIEKTHNRLESMVLNGKRVNLKKKHYSPSEYVSHIDHPNGATSSSNGVWKLVAIPGRI